MSSQIYRQFSKPLKGSCGHYLKKHDGPDGRGNPVIVREVREDDTRIISYRNVCNMCKHEYLMNGMLVMSPQEQTNWLAPLPHN